ncbi:putative motility protein [Chromobacterium haemolyticum]|uniref:Motility protein n=1 Tax=Chromobacterium haemolyticum TaxID=394935 RepID=A0ABS3GIC4_9NEIS|nr:putative motility protein [Chromobacterium haemolyticum]MBK0413235.1 putative motility protein [Chromobacterium haemolyticum]MBO0414337.1 putative motility protein [Chromobacterium haemolyticum]MBO0497804.1 putative motility protein [Chromobacterium haemolyticum]OQS40449.1 putative motility protein [Chromobacterium haemolyticum]
MDGLSQISGQGVSNSIQIYALKKAMSASAQSALSLVQGASDNMAQAQASNPAHLGQNIDTRA